MKYGVQKHTCANRTNISFPEISNSYSSRLFSIIEIDDIFMKGTSSLKRILPCLIYLIGQQKWVKMKRKFVLDIKKIFMPM